MCDRVDKWKLQVKELLQLPIDVCIQNKEKLKNALNDARVLKLPDKMLKEVS